MIKNRTVQLVFLSMACTLGVLGAVASLGVFNYNFRREFYIQFTNLSNYLCIAILFAELVQTIRKKEDSFVSVCPRLKFVGMVVILLTFLVFNIVLAPARDAYLNFRINSVILHVLIPVVYVLDWILFYERKKVKWYYPLYALLFPLVYAIFVYGHAAILGFDTTILIEGTTTPLIYPYFFLDLEKQGIGGVAMWMGILLAILLVVGFLFVGIDRLGKKKV